MNIGAASKESGVSVKMIRYYESIGLIGAATRSEGGYRVYGPADVQGLHFIRQARNLGFSLAEIERLLALWRKGDRASAEVKALALAHIADLESRIARLTEWKEALQGLADSCHGDQCPDCSILDALATPPKR